MARARQVLVANTATQLAGPDMAGGSNVFISNPTGSVADVFIGGDVNQVTAPGQAAASLSIANGYLLKVGTQIGPIRLAGNEKLYAITNTATTSISVFTSSGRP